MPNRFYTAKPVKKRVSKAEFDEFLKNYPRALDCDVFKACDPPAVSYNDFALANRWPYSIVASTFIYEEDPHDLCNIYFENYVEYGNLCCDSCIVVPMHELLNLDEAKQALEKYK